MGFDESEQVVILRIIVVVFYLGNLNVVKESRFVDQVRLVLDGKEVVVKVCKLLGVLLQFFLQGLLYFKVKVGREWVEKVQILEQVWFSIDVLVKGIYE